ncbi:hypothetical protein [Flavobacterium lindanitolerans]|nr:hypothetical protein [Flavobacterium lindanitolerans]
MEKLHLIAAREMVLFPFSFIGVKNLKTNHPLPRNDMPPYFKYQNHIL